MKTAKNSGRIQSKSIFNKLIVSVCVVVYCLLLHGNCYAEINVEKVMAELKEFSQRENYFYELDEEKTRKFIIALNTIHIGDSKDEVMAKLEIQPSANYTVYGYKYFIFKYVRYSMVKYWLKKLDEYGTVLNYDLTIFLHFDKNKKLENIASNIKSLAEDDRIEFSY